jgi:Acetyltransferases
MKFQKKASQEAFFVCHKTETMIIREGRVTDLQQVFQLIVELAEFEKGLHEVTNSVEMMEKDGFGQNPLYGFLVAEDETRIAGLSLYYWRYSTWKGKRLYLEDIIVTKTERGKGIGKKLFDRTMKLAIEKNCTGMMWQALDWNQPAIEFYKQYGARLDNEWINFSLETEKIKKLIESK